MVGDIFMRIWFAGSTCILTGSCNEDDLLSEDHLDFLIQWYSWCESGWKNGNLWAVFHPEIAISQNKDERLCKEHELEGVSSLILDFEAVRMNVDGPHLSRLYNGHMESLNRIAKDLKKNDRLPVCSWRRSSDKIRLTVLRFPLDFIIA